MDIKPTLEKLFSLHQFGIKLGLESTVKLLKQIGNPHKKLKCYHVAGSNGKGSTSSFIASILMEHGFKVGLYTSPHFVRFNERIKINGEEIPNEVIVKFVDQLENYIEENKPTFFELTTALAFKYFYQQKVDYAVIETGLGGRLDATNVIDPIASVITTISLEHTQHLGNTIEQIAFEKAGIIKNEKPVFVGNVCVDSKKVIANKAKETNSQILFLNDFSMHDNDLLTIDLPNPFYIYETPLKGEHQKSNAALAVKTVYETLNDFDNLKTSVGINNVLLNTKLEGRYEVISEIPKIIFDSAHNPEGVESFINLFQKENASYSKKTLIFGAMRDKNISQMLSALVPHFDEIYISAIKEERAAAYNEIIETQKYNVDKMKKLDEPNLLIQKILNGKEAETCLVVLGSMYLLGEIKSKILKKELDIKPSGV